MKVVVIFELGARNGTQKGFDVNIPTKSYLVQIGCCIGGKLNKMRNIDYSTIPLSIAYLLEDVFQPPEPNLP